MYLLKFKLENNTEPYSIYICLNAEVKSFNNSIEFIKKEHEGETISIAAGNEIYHFKDVNELTEKCLLTELNHNEHDVLSRLRIGNDECAAQCIFDAVCSQEMVFEPKETMEMGM